MPKTADFTRDIRTIAKQGEISKGALRNLIEEISPDLCANKAVLHEEINTAFSLHQQQPNG